MSQVTVESLTAEINRVAAEWQAEYDQSGNLKDWPKLEAICKVERRLIRQRAKLLKAEKAALVERLREINEMLERV